MSTTINKSYLAGKSKKIRQAMIEILVPEESHHIGCSFSVVDILTYLYFKILRVNVKNPKDPARDIFLLSKGHAGLSLYATLFEKGFIKRSLLDSYDQNGGKLPEHASTTCPGVELSTGSLGHALPIGIGFSMSFKKDKKDNRVYVLLSDGELDEGSNWEAIMFAGHHNLDNLTAIIDLNGLQGYDETRKVLNLSPIADKISSFGWNIYECNGHDFTDLGKTFAKIAKNKSNKPNLIIARTTKGKGVPYFEGRFDSHYKSVDKITKKKILEEFIDHI